MEYSQMSTKPQRSCSPGMWTLLAAILIFGMTLMGVALLEAERDKTSSGDSFILVRRIWTQLTTPTNESEHAVVATVERIARDAANSSQVTGTGHSNNYYEEQQAVVVKEETAPPAMAERRDSFGPPGGLYDEDMDPNYDDYQTAEDPPESSYPARSEETAEGRAAQSRPQDSYYAPWRYETQSATPSSNNYRKLQPAGNSPPYPVYDEVYDYPMGFQPRPHVQPQAKQVAPTPAQAVAHAPATTESSLILFLKTLKQMWDLYQAISTAWGSVAQRHQESAEQLKKERLEKQRLRQQLQQQQNRTRINSKKPPRMDDNKDAKPTQINHNKKAKTTTTTTSSSSESEESEEATPAPVLVKPGKETNKETAAKGDSASQSSVRGQRHRREPEPERSSDVGEGRYIKGDPLKGYYDFVITEGSYKFWAAFQVGTALLIIYSTFAAIYYSKVNPLTSDYDYQDYLGAGRSMTGGDDDFVDDSEPTTSTPSAKSRIVDWLPRTAHSLQFILDAIDKIPVDHEKEETGWSAGKGDTGASEEATGASR